MLCDQAKGRVTRTVEITPVALKTCSSVPCALAWLTARRARVRYKQPLKIIEVIVGVGDRRRYPPNKLAALEVARTPISYGKRHPIPIMLLQKGQVALCGFLQCHGLAADFQSLKSSVMHWGYQINNQ